MIALEEKLHRSSGAARTDLRQQLDELRDQVSADRQGAVAEELDHVHSVQRAQKVGSIDVIPPVGELRPYLVNAIQRGMAKVDGG